MDYRFKTYQAFHTHWVSRKLQILMPPRVARMRNNGDFHTLLVGAGKVQV